MESLSIGLGNYVSSSRVIAIVSPESAPVKRMVQEAYNEGIPHSKTKGRLNKWVTSLFFKNMNANNIRLYGDKAYIFCNKILVTVIQIPASLTKDLKEMIRQK